MRVFVLIFTLLLTSFVKAIELPSPSNKLVNDYAHLLSPQENNDLENRLRKYNDSTSTEIVIVTVQSLEGGSIFDYSQNLFRKWGIGKSDKDNGVLIVIAPNERKTRIHTGYGMEGVLPDLACKKMINNMKPLFKKGRYYEGIVLAFEEIKDRASGSYKGDGKKTSNAFWWLIIFFLFIFLVIPYLRQRFLPSVEVGSFGYDLLTMYGLFSLFDGRGGYNDFNSGRGDFSGFDGFGGGDSGGGGAEGDW